MTARVVQWATGTTGRLALRAVIDDPELELVGVRVYDVAKAGKDAGELVDRPPTGVLTTDRKEDVLALQPDVVLFMGRAEQDTDGCVRDIADLLAGGINVVATGAPLIDVRAVDADRGRLLDAACKEGSSSFLGLGLFPGFWGEALVPVLSRLAYQCDHIAVREALSYAGYPSTHLLFNIMGYGHAPDSTEPMLAKPRTGNSPFNGTATIIAKALGLEIDSIESFRETAVTDIDLEVAAGSIPAGTVGAMKLGVKARCGPVTISVEHVTWMSPAVAPEWSEREGYEIELDGAPTLRCNLLLGTKGEDHTEMGCLATAMHAVHAIPRVRAAEPGVLDLADVAGFVGSLP